MENSNLLTGIEYTSALDLRTCLICGSYDGSIYFYEKEPNVLEAPYLPVHPLCRCLYTPITRLWEDTFGSLEIRQSKYGKTTKNFPEWLRHREEINPGSAKKVLGSKYESWLNGEYVLNPKTLKFQPQITIQNYLESKGNLANKVKTKSIKNEAKKILKDKKKDIVEKAFEHFKEQNIEIGIDENLGYTLYSSDDEPDLVYRTGNPQDIEGFYNSFNQELVKRKTNIKEFLKGFNTTIDGEKLFKKFILTKHYGTEGHYEIEGKSFIGAKIVREFFNNFKEVEHSLFILPPELRNKGLGKKILKNSLEVYKKLGIEKIELFAGLETGGYVWAMAGFEADKDMLKIFRNKLGNGFKNSKEFAFIADRIKNMQHIQELAAFSVDLETWKLFKKDSNLDFERIFPKINFTNFQDLETKLKEKYCLDEKNNLLKIGKGFLLGTNWEGILDLTDEKQRKLFEIFVNKE